MLIISQDEASFSCLRHFSLRGREARFWRCPAMTVTYPPTPRRRVSLALVLDNNRGNPDKLVCVGTSGRHLELQLQPLGADGNISHFILECSPSAQLSDFFDASGDFSASLLHIHAAESVQPESARHDTWPKVRRCRNYCRGLHIPQHTRACLGQLLCSGWAGHNPPGTFNTAWNTGFLLPTPPKPSVRRLGERQATGPGHADAVPDASTIVLVCFGALQLLAVRKKGLQVSTRQWHQPPC